ncbi:ABC transporter substrate-binding protein [Amnibacterium endophyticum]|uniref:ABC transporter substrate-binding protein n=1 Tax=Amnibacterium endophyticum TaxID=2109337 RepID=A0ABW4L9V4_9MICO
MRYKRGTTALVAVFAAGALALTGCSGGGGGNTTNPSSSTGGGSATFNGAVDGVVNPSTKTGGTIKLLSDSDCDSWDPARTYYGWCFNMQRLFSRTLIGYKNVNGDKYELGPDLATDMGTHNADYTQWKYTLKDGLKYSDGTDIKAEDIKWATERIFATDQINGGPTQYFLDVIKAPSGYKGPYQGKELDSIQVSGNTITFNLSKPYADFNYLLALPTLAPVPAKVEGGKGYVGGTYAKKPVSSGPFELSSYTPQKSATFTRNKYWEQSTDTIHKPLADEIDLTIDTDPNDIDNKLLAGAADAKANVDVGSTLQTKIFTDAKTKANADNPATPFTRYLTIPQSVIPNQDCRAAINYALDKAAVLQAFGGNSHGQVAASFTPPGIPGHEDGSAYDPYNTAATKGKGDIAKAKEALAKCGQPNGFSTKMAYSTPSQTGPKVFAAVQQSLAKVGIKVTPATSDASNYYSTFVGSPANVKNQGLGLILAGWGADFPTGYGFYNSIVNGKNILPTGNSNYGSLNNPTINKILDESTGGSTTEEQWQQLNHTLMETGADLPLLWGKSLYYRNPRLTNVACNNALAFGIYDWVNMGVSGS